MGALSNIFMLMSFTLSIGIGIWIIQFDRNLREDNTCADVLAKTGPRLRICFISTLWECLSRLITHGVSEDIYRVQKTFIGRSQLRRNITMTGFLTHYYSKGLHHDGFLACCLLGRIRM
ncbi:hypothetical protein GmHk_18G052879 [Glycine max]|nr:hypothetical protein GYH30_050714 [Glycine max]KAH1155537.1 hypothetical protein GYH30_050714 [Glycine max]KAH1199541.1 hypothetical protein GmHk_18G052879 [Glycine max]